MTASFILVCKYLIKVHARKKLHLCQDTSCFVENSGEKVVEGVGKKKIGNSPQVCQVHSENVIKKRAVGKNIYFMRAAVREELSATKTLQESAFFSGGKKRGGPPKNKAARGLNASLLEATEGTNSLQVTQVHLGIVTKKRTMWWGLSSMKERNGVNHQRLKQLSE